MTALDEDRASRTRDSPTLLARWAAAAEPIDVAPIPAASMATCSAASDTWTALNPAIAATGSNAGRSTALSLAIGRVVCPPCRTGSHQHPKADEDREPGVPTDPTLCVDRHEHRPGDINVAILVPGGRGRAAGASMEPRSDDFGRGFGADAPRRLDHDGSDRSDRKKSYRNRLPVDGQRAERRPPHPGRHPVARRQDQPAGQYARPAPIVSKTAAATSGLQLHDDAVSTESTILVLPHSNDPPPSGCQHAVGLLVARRVAVKLDRPVLRVRSR